MRGETHNRQVFSSGEVRCFEREEDGDWKLTKHTKAPGQKKTKIRAGMKMKTCDKHPPYQPEVTSDVE